MTNSENKPISPAHLTPTLSLSLPLPSVVRVIFIPSYRELTEWMHIQSQYFENAAYVPMTYITRISALYIDNSNHNRTNLWNSDSHIALFFFSLTLFAFQLCASLLSHSWTDLLHMLEGQSRRTYCTITADCFSLVLSYGCGYWSRICQSDNSCVHR